VVLATCHSSGGHQLRAQEFDVVIIDEATQALEAVGHILTMAGMTLTHVAGLLDTHIQG
jgi:DNA polymerase alpha-associated DNA helicase A